MRIENLYSFLVPLMFLALWALTSLFNRETQPLPPRSGRPANSLGPRPGSIPSRNLSQTRPQGSMGSRPPNKADDGILILETENRSNLSGGPGNASAKRPGRPRQQSPSPSRPREAKASSKLSDSMTAPAETISIHDQLRNQSSSLKPLSLPPSPLLSTPSEVSSSTAVIQGVKRDGEATSLSEIRNLVQSTSRLREGLILSEILKPPLALRIPPPTRRPRPRKA